MIDPTTVSNEEIERRYEALPDDVLEAFEGADASRRIFEIAKAEGIAIDKIGEVARAVGYILLGVMPASDLPEALVSDLGDQGKANKIALAISEKIFLPIRESMKKIEGERTREYLYAGGRAKEPAGARTPETKPVASVPSLTRVSTPPPLTESATEPETGEFAKKPEPMIINPPTFSRESRQVDKESQAPPPKPLVGGQAIREGGGINPLSPRHSYAEEAEKSFISPKPSEDGITVKPLETTDWPSRKESPEAKKENAIPKAVEEIRQAASPREIRPFKPAMMGNAGPQSAFAAPGGKEKTVELQKMIVPEKNAPPEKAVLPPKVIPPEMTAPPAEAVVPPGYASIKKEFEKEFMAFSGSKTPEKSATDGEKVMPAKASTPLFTVTKEKILAEIERARAGLKGEAHGPESRPIETKTPRAPDKVPLPTPTPTPVPTTRIPLPSPEKNIQPPRPQPQPQLQPKPLIPQPSVVEKAGAEIPQERKVLQVESPKPVTHITPVPAPEKIPEKPAVVNKPRTFLQGIGPLGKEQGTSLETPQQDQEASEKVRGKYAADPYREPIE